MFLSYNGWNYDWRYLWGRAFLLNLFKRNSFATVKQMWKTAQELQIGYKKLKAQVKIDENSLSKCVNSYYKLYDLPEPKFKREWLPPPPNVHRLLFQIKTESKLLEQYNHAQKAKLPTYFLDIFPTLVSEPISSAQMGLTICYRCCGEKINKYDMDLMFLVRQRAGVALDSYSLKNVCANLLDSYNQKN